MKKTLVLGAGGFIGGHLVKRLKAQGCYVKGVDLVPHAYTDLPAHDFVIGDLRDPRVVAQVIDQDVDEIYQLAADMGGAGYIFTGDNDADVMHNSATINLNVASEAVKKGAKKVFYSSSACMYPEYNQLDPSNPKCAEDSAYPAYPDSEYGWEKLFSERLFLAFKRNYNLNVRVARFHNIFGPQGSWNNGKEKAPAALCRKVAQTESGGSIDVWGDGLQTRSFLYIDECLEAVERLMQSNFTGPVNIGSEEMVSINDFAKMIIRMSGKDIKIENIPGPEGVRGRNSDNDLIYSKLGWKPTQPLAVGLQKTYDWISHQVATKAVDQ